MGLDPEAWARKQLKQSEDWYRRRSADIEARKQDLENLGREFWNAGTRAGQFVAGETPQKLQQVGSIARQGVTTPHGAAVRGAGSRHEVKGGSKPPKGPLSAQSKILDRTEAGLRGVSDGATFGLGDRLSAVVRAGAPFDDKWGDRYAANMQGERDQDAFDQQHFPMSRGAGQVVGALGAMALTGREAALGSRLVAGFGPRAATFLKGVAATGREAPLARGLADHLRWSSYAAGGGGTFGGGTQVAIDAAQGRLSNPKDVAAAMVGGAADGVGTIYLGPGRGGAVGGGVTAAMDDVLAGRDLSVGDIASGALAGDLAGKSVGALGTLGSHALPGNAWISNSSAMRAKQAAAGVSGNKTPWLQDKGSLGDRLSEMRSRLEFERVGKRQVSRKLSRGSTRVDHVTKSGRPVEAKFGYSATLSPRQKQAVTELDGYRIDHFLPRDMGKLVALPGTAIASPIYDFMRGDRR